MFRLIFCVHRRQAAKQGVAALRPRSQHVAGLGLVERKQCRPKLFACDLILWHVTNKTCTFSPHRDLSHTSQCSRDSLNSKAFNLIFSEVSATASFLPMLLKAPECDLGTLLHSQGCHGADPNQNPNIYRSARVRTRVMNFSLAIYLILSIHGS